MKGTMVVMLAAILLLPALNAEPADEAEALQERVNGAEGYSKAEKEQLKEMARSCRQDGTGDGAGKMTQQRQRAKRMEQRMLRNKLREGMAKGAEVKKIKKAMERSRSRLRYSKSVTDRFGGADEGEKIRCRQRIAAMMERGFSKEEIDGLAREAKRQKKAAKVFGDCLATADELQGKGMSKKNALAAGKDVATGKRTRAQARQRWQKRHQQGAGERDKGDGLEDEDERSGSLDQERGTAAGGGKGGGDGRRGGK